MSRRRAAANAHPIVVVDYGPDTFGSRFARLYGGLTLRGARGETGTVYGIEKGDPTACYTGASARASQRFTGGAFLAANASVVREQNGTIETGIADAPYGDPARRILAQRLLRRT
jgi:hypothetical protein